MARNEKDAGVEMLDALFDTARRRPIAPDPVFLARLTADMENALPNDHSAKAAQARRTGFFERFGAIFAASGLTGVAALGVWIGFVMPETLNSLAAGYTTVETVGIGSFLPSADLEGLGE